MAIRPAFATVRTIFSRVAYFVHAWRFCLPVTQRPLSRWPTTPCSSRNVTDPAPEIVKTIWPWETFGLDTVGTPGSAVFDTPGVRRAGGAGRVRDAAGGLTKEA